MDIFSFWERQKIAFGLLLGDTAYMDTFGFVAPEQAYHQVLADPVFAHFTQVS